MMFYLDFEEEKMRGYRIKDMKKHRKFLIEEAVNRQTKLDTLPDESQSLSGEAEAMYFKSIRDFFKNNIFKFIVK